MNIDASPFRVCSEYMIARAALTHVMPPIEVHLTVPMGPRRGRPAVASPQLVRVGLEHLTAAALVMVRLMAKQAEVELRF